MRNFAKDREICNAAIVARDRVMEIAGQEAHTQEELREMSKCFDVTGKFAKEARVGWPAALDRIAELEAENARLKEQPANFCTDCQRDIDNCTCMVL